MPATHAAPSLYGGVLSVTTIYGLGGLGKTTDCLYAFPGGYYIAPPGALKPAHSIVGCDPKCDDAKTISEAAKLLREAGKKGQYAAVIVDDFSHLAQATVSELEGKGLDGFKLWGALRDEVLNFRDQARRCGMHIVLTAHEAPPRTVKGAAVRGGPQLPGKLPEDLPTACDLVLRMTQDSTRRGWHANYRCTVDDPMWTTKDRHGVTPDRAPANLGEILRAAGYVLPRATGLEWQDEVVDVLSKALLNDPANATAYLREAQSMCESKTENPFHVRWVMRDALDRAALVRARQNPYALYL